MSISHVKKELKHASTNLQHCVRCHEEFDESNSDKSNLCIIPHQAGVGVEMSFRYGITRRCKLCDNPSLKQPFCFKGSHTTNTEKINISNHCKSYKHHKCKICKQIRWNKPIKYHQSQYQ